MKYESRSFVFKAKEKQSKKKPRSVFNEGFINNMTMIVELSERAAHNNCIYMPNEKILIFSGFTLFNLKLTIIDFLFD